MSNLSRITKIGRAIQRTKIGRKIGEAYESIADRAHLGLTKHGKSVKQYTKDSPFVRKEILRNPGLVRAKGSKGFFPPEGLAAEAGAQNAVRRHKAGLPVRRASQGSSATGRSEHSNLMNEWPPARSDVLKPLESYNRGFEGGVHHTEMMKAHSQLVGKGLKNLNPFARAMASAMNNSLRSMRKDKVAEGYKQANKMGRGAVIGGGSLAAGSAYFAAKRKSR